MADQGESTLRMPIECGPCTLRPFRESDVDSLAAVANDRDIWLNLRDRFPHPYTRENAVTFIGVCAAQKIQTNFAICVDDKAIGGIGLTPGTDIERVNAEIGYWIGRAYWGRGIVTA